jgi:hypothetical protein
LAGAIVGAFAGLLIVVLIIIFFVRQTKPVTADAIIVTSVHAREMEMGMKKSYDGSYLARATVIDDEEQPSPNAPPCYSVANADGLEGESNPKSEPIYANK